MTYFEGCDPRKKLSFFVVVFKEFPDLVRIKDKVKVENKGSQKVLENVGFLKEGLLRKYGICKGEIIDMFIYSFLVTDSML